MRPIQSFSTSVDKFLETIRSYGRPTSCFPQNLDEQQSRRRAGESLHDWFVRLVDKFGDGEPKRYALERNLAIFALLGWQKGRDLSISRRPAIRRAKPRGRLPRRTTGEPVRPSCPSGGRRPSGGGPASERTTLGLRRCR